MADTIDLGWGPFPAEQLRYMVRTCRDVGGVLRSPANEAKGFVWPQEIGAVVEAPDWSDRTKRGGVHGLIPGQQGPWGWATGPDAVWMIVSFDSAESVDLGGKTKVRRCRVEWVCRASDGAASSAVAWLRARGITEPVYAGHATVGDYGVAVTGDYGVATAGYRGVATVGDFGHATVGDYGTATAGDSGRVSGGVGALLVVRTADGWLTGVVGQGGIKPGVTYRADRVGGSWQLVEASGA